MALTPPPVILNPSGAPVDPFDLNALISRGAGAPTAGAGPVVSGPGGGGIPFQMPMGTNSTNVPMFPADPGLNPQLQRQAPNMFGSGGGSMQNVTARGIPRPFNQRPISSAVNIADGGAGSVRPTPAMQGGGGAGGATAAGSAGKFHGPFQGQPHGPFNSARPSGWSSWRGPTPNPFPNMNANPAGTSGSWMKGVWQGVKPQLRPAGINAAKGLGVSLGFEGLARASGDNPSLRAGANASHVAGLAGPYAAAIAGPAVAAGDAGGRIMTGAPDWFNSQITDSPTEKRNTQFVQQQSVDLLKDQLPGPLGAVADFFATPGLRQDSIGMADLPFIGGFFGSASEGEEAAGPTAPPLPSTDEDWGALLQRSGMSRSGVDQALSEYNRLREFNRVKSELGLLTYPATNDKGQMVDADGNVTDDPSLAAQVAVTPEEVDTYSASMFSQAIPELVMSDEERLDAQLRAAAYRQFVQQQMAPQMELQKATADMYGQILGDARLPAEYASILPQTTRLFDAANTLEADAIQQQMMMLPEIQAIQSQMAEDQALQQAISGALLQEQVAGYKADNPLLFPSLQQAPDLLDVNLLENQG